jgi:hypothetical protein
MRDAHHRALQAGLAWRPVADSNASPYELRAGTGRRGPTSSGRFDAAVQQLNEDGAGENSPTSPVRTRR